MVNKTEKAVLGEPYHLSCSLPSSAEIQLCSWSREGGADMVQQEGKLLDHQRREIKGITGDNKDTRLD